MYEKTLRLPTWVLGEGRMSTGSVMNHMTIDPLNVCLFFYMSHLTWAIVVQVGGPRNCRSTHIFQFTCWSC